MGGCHKHGVAWLSKYDNDPTSFCEDCKQGKPPFHDVYTNKDNERIIELLISINANLECLVERGNS